MGILWNCERRCDHFDYRRILIDLVKDPKIQTNEKRCSAIPFGEIDHETFHPAYEKSGTFMDILPLESPLCKPYDQFYQSR